MEKKNHYSRKIVILMDLIILGVLIALDQIIKASVIRTLKDNEAFVLIPNVLEFDYLENRGSVWGILQGRISFLLIVSLMLFAILLFVYIRLPKEKHYLPLIWIDVFMIAGAVGNTIDRIFFGYF